MRLKPGIILALIEISYAWNFINFMTGNVNDIFRRKYQTIHSQRHTYRCGGFPN